jgi:signal transduction histidine kinase
MELEQASESHDGRAGRLSSAANVAFLLFFVLYTAGSVLWLAMGLVPVLAHIFPGVADVLREWGTGSTWLADVAQRMLVASAGGYADQGFVTLATFYLFSAVNLGLGVFLIWLRPHDLVARLLALGMVGTAAAFNLPSHAFTNVFGGPVVRWLHVTFHLVSGAAYLYAVVLFPDGTLVPRWSKWPLRALYLGVTSAVTLGAARLVYTGSTSVVGSFVVFFGVLIPLVGVTAQTYRYRHAVAVGERQEARLLRLALTPALVAGLAFVFVRLAQPADAAELESLVVKIFPALFAIIPVALFFGILRYRLWGIDVVVSKAFLYGALAAFIAAVYLGLVVGIGGAIGTGDQPNTGLAILATGLVAVAFQPVRERLKSFANRLVYGERATPYDVLSDFGERMAGSLSLEETLPRMAEATAKGVGAIRSRVRVLLPGGGERSASWPPGSDGNDFDRAISVIHQGEQVGDIWVAKPQGESLTAVEDRLLSDLASEVGLALRNVRLTVELQGHLDELSSQSAELRASRERIAAARDAERRRLERDIHDGAQQRLVALAVKARLARTLAGRDPAQAQDMLIELENEAQEALETLRDLAHGIYPAILTDQGLVPALRSHVSKTSLRVTVDQVGVGRYGAETEAAAFFCCLEALQNVAKYAVSSQVRVRVEDGGGELVFAVTDDGKGFHPDRISSGSGLQGMIDRLEALGGHLDVQSAPGRGTTVTGRIPV